MNIYPTNTTSNNSTSVQYYCCYNNNTSSNSTISTSIILTERRIALGNTQNFTCSNTTMPREAGASVYANTTYVGPKPRTPIWKTMKSKPWRREWITG